ncbi:hypothetical protein VZO05_16445 (plasmid) [Aggregatilineales bacterium SYSU G02658]
MSVVFETVEYHGWRSTRLHNGLIELIVPQEIGIRVMRLGFIGQPNQFLEVPEQLGARGGDAWRIYGGHRLWHAPETFERTYSRDNFPVAHAQHGSTLVVTQAVDHAGIEKQVEITLDAAAARVTVLHRLTNKGLWPVTLAVWALSVMANGGVTIVPLPPRGSHETDLLPNTRLTLWPYTDMSDPRWTWGREYVLLRHDAQAAAPQKFGLANVHGWAAHWHAGTLFACRAAHQPHAEYPDYGCSYEFFTNYQIMEVETLSPLTTLAPNESAEHAETWHLWADVPEPRTEAAAAAHIAPLLAASRGWGEGR